MEASLATIEAGLAFGWLPEHLIRSALERGAIRPLPLVAGGSRNVPLNLVLVNTDLAGPAARAAAEAFERHRPVTQLDRAAQLSIMSPVPPRET